MNIPFPVLTPRLVDSSWFHPDKPHDEEAELDAMEQANQVYWANILGKESFKRIPYGLQNGLPEPMEPEAETDEEEGNEESEETEESHDDEEEEDEEVHVSYSPQNVIDVDAGSPDNLD